MNTYQIRIIDRNEKVEIVANDEADLLNKLMVKYRGCDYEILSMKEGDTRPLPTRVFQDYFPPFESDS